jgi:23S rRNA (adenine2030-N6)-methyltransferase
VNYRHVYHAGNFADVVKHAVLTLSLLYLQRKDKGFLVLDTHAGKGLYQLDDPMALKTGEALGGITRVMNATDPPAALSLFLRVVKDVRERHGKESYPGSPLIAAALLRPQDRLVAIELQPSEAKALAATLAPFRRARVIAEDGYHALKAHLPPPERRALVLVDPPFETEGELTSLAKALEGAVTRFPTGLYLVWVPLKERKAIESIYGEIQSAGLRDVTSLEWQVREPIAGVGLTSAALILINAPFTLRDELGAVMPWMMRTLAQGPGAGWELRRITPE